jgi:hypothetical protein
MHPLKIFIPGQNSVFNSVLTPGVDYSAYPRPRTITLGVNMSF